MFKLSITAGTFGGTLCTLLIVPWADIARTFLLSGIGAASSFFVSLLLHKLLKKKK
jgi:hypothetical protein